jgi:hypothetical protein
MDADGRRRPTFWCQSDGQTPLYTQIAIPGAPTLPPPAGCQDSDQYVSDDGMDGTTYAPNTPFSKMWRLKNTGTCTWDSTYPVAYLAGTALTQQPGYWIVQPGQTVAPGQTVDVSVGMTSPVENTVNNGATGSITDQSI